MAGTHQWKFPDGSRSIQQELARNSQKHDLFQGTPPARSFGAQPWILRFKVTLENSSAGRSAQRFSTASSIKLEAGRRLNRRSQPIARHEDSGQARQRLLGRSRSEEHTSELQSLRHL